MEIREKILPEAARLFAIKGYHDTKLEAVLAAAQVTTGAFFHHFGGKEELGFAVIDRHTEKRRQLLEDIQNRLPPTDDDHPLSRVFRRLDAIQGVRIPIPEGRGFPAGLVRVRIRSRRPPVLRPSDLRPDPDRFRSGSLGTPHRVCQTAV